MQCIPSHEHYCEPYFGSGAVLFSKPRARHEIVNDISGDVVNLFRVVRDRGLDLATLIETTPWARAEFELSYEACADDIERARRFLVRTWQGHSGALDHRTGWTSQGTSLSYVTPVEKWLQVPDRIRAAIERLRYVEIDNRPGLEVIARHKSADVLLYVDPPYVHSTRNSRAYADEMTDADHIALLDTLEAHPGPVLLSGYHCELYDNKLSHWDIRECQVQANRAAIRTEVLWLNQTCIDRLGYGPLFQL